ncbi:unnamed protein product [Brassicogethes aeneus]|uniref:Transposable element P transposase n=1 Tax=Brassicogethes aeneus TaxID=1431903 RepID=A0A9P0FPW6_BRAAE|nr:unnamed protein product [Brassicogethes aeneus]
MKKMKVSYATQVLSHSVASFISLLSRTQIIGGIEEQQKATDTATILKIFDSLFDSVNGSTLYEQRGKKLKCAVSAGPGHIEFWRDARNHLKNMYYVKPNSSERIIPPSIKNWISTLASLEEIHNILSRKNITFFRPRMINQDPVEIFFSQVRQHAGRNSNPTIHNFKNYFKTLLINNFTARHSLSANCEDDDSSHIISSVRQFVTMGVPEEMDMDIEEYEKLMSGISLPTGTTKKYIDQISIGYVSGFI